MKFQIFLIISQQFLYPAFSACIDQARTPLNIGKIPACPFYDDTPVCCRQDNVDQMISNYRSIDATFGQDGGGCDICGANLKRFWCIYTCDPNQTNFIEYTGRANVTDPSNKNRLIEVQLVSLTTKPQIACEVYSSCSRTSFVNQVSAMQSPGGFFNFLGEQAISQGQQFITFQFSDHNSMIMDDTWMCNHKSNITTVDDKGVIHYWDQYGYEIKQQCGCNTCEDSCDINQILYEPTGVLYGFETSYVLFTWLFAILFALGITIIRKYRKNNEVIENLDIGLITT
ncbi:unnamed protein product [Paramecium octaurelia]|uniref:Niemann-Pick C1 N-terminal domain-containing protein n=1 Tax=Paramecium octaurelia TaxID=43137 RepID=A0A8S1VAG2_PAROT|nr:unnamed protein product [Paramecium octaurelia]